MLRLSNTAPRAVTGPFDAEPYHGPVEKTDTTETTADEPLDETRRHRGLVQATVPPIDQDGLTGALIGTGTFLVATIVCWLRRASLRAAGYGDWVWICLTGTVLGVLGTLYIFGRRRRIAARRTD